MSLATEAPKQSSVDAPGLKPVSAVAKFLAISRSKVYQLMESGQLPYVKLGKSRRVRWADVLKLVDDNTIKSARSLPSQSINLFNEPIRSRLCKLNEK